MPLADYRDTVTGEEFEVFIKERALPEEIINENTGNKATRIYTQSKGIGGMDLTSADRAAAKVNYQNYKNKGRA